MELGDLLEKDEQKKVLEDACGELRGDEQEECIRFFEERVEEEEEKKVTEEE